MQMTEVINQFKGKYNFLSNFYICRIDYDGLTFNSTEAAYQAAKCADPKDKRRFCGLNSAESKKLGLAVTLRSDWDSIKVQVMREVLECKFRSHPHLAKALIETRQAQLIEGNWWNDKFWGVCLKTNEGENQLGKLLMELRVKLYKELKDYVVELKEIYDNNCGIGIVTNSIYDDLLSTVLIYEKGMPAIKQTIPEKIRQRRAQMLIHSYIYYKLDDNIVSDHQWQRWAFELAELQNENPDCCSIGFFDQAFEGWTGAHGGSHLPLDDLYVRRVARRVLDRSRKTNAS